MKGNYLDSRGSVAVPMLLIIVLVVIFFLIYRLIGDREQIIVEPENGELVATTTNQVRAMRSNIDAAEEIQRTLNQRGQSMDSLMQDI